MYLTRLIENKIHQISKLYSVILITGPRQVGKTELAKHLFPNHRWVLLDSRALIDQAKSDPALFLDSYRPPVIFDEVQRVPELFLEIKNRIDQGQAQLGEIVLTGSQPLQLMDQVADSLAGRVGVVELAPLLPSELRSSLGTFTSPLQIIQDPPLGRKFLSPFGMSETLLRGFMPAMSLREKSPNAEDAVQRLNDYVQTYLERDLRDLSEVHNLGLFERFMRVIALSSARLTNLSESAGQISLPQSTAQHWLGLLKASQLAFELPAYHISNMKRETKRPKLFLNDSGLMVSLLGLRTSEQIDNSPLMGAIFETAVVNLIRNALILEPARKQFFHWRSGEKDEVDCVIESPTGELYAIEIKASGTPKTEFASGIEKFREHTKKHVYGAVVTAAPDIFWLKPNVVHLPWWVF